MRNVTPAEASPIPWYQMCEADRRFDSPKNPFKEIVPVAGKQILLPYS
jgi:hypothetical protein